jgi:hypothetical protein
MAHKLIGDKVVVDWTTGDPEGDRITLLAAYRDFITEARVVMEKHKEEYNLFYHLRDLFEKWCIDTENQIDEIPRIWIKRPGS